MGRKDEEMRKHGGPARLGGVRPEPTETGLGEEHPIIPLLEDPDMHDDWSDYLQRLLLAFLSHAEDWVNGMESRDEFAERVAEVRKQLDKAGAS